jgi:hypothetical protein
MSKTRKKRLHRKLEGSPARSAEPTQLHMYGYILSCSCRNDRPVQEFQASHAVTSQNNERSGVGFGSLAELWATTRP